MKKIRINELARELEVKPGIILDILADLGVQDKKTHSSSIDEDVSLVVRERLSNGEPDGNRFHAAGNGRPHETADEPARVKEQMIESSAAVAEPPAAEAPAAEETPSHAAAGHSAAGSMETAGIAGKPAGSGPFRPPLRDQFSKEKEVPPVAAMPVGIIAPTPAEPEKTEPEKVVRPLPLRPPLGGGSALQPPLAPAPGAVPSVPVPRNISIPVRPSPPPLRPGLAPTGPRQPLPEAPRGQLGVPQSPPQRPQPRPAGPGAPPVQHAPAHITVQPPSAPQAPLVHAPPARPAASPQTPAALHSSPAQPSAPQPHAAPSLPQPPTHVMAPERRRVRRLLPPFPARRLLLGRQSPDPV